MYILICHVTFLCPPKDFAQATALISDEGSLPEIALSGASNWHQLVLHYFIEVYMIVLYTEIYHFIKESRRCYVHWGI